MKMQNEGPLVRLGQGDYEHTWPPVNLIRESNADYRARSKDYLSSHSLADFRKCPLLFRRKELGLIVDRDTSAYALGRAAHVLILEGRERYEAEFAVGGPINEKTGKPFGSNTKAFTEWAAECGKPVLSDTDAATVEQMAASVKKHLLASDLLSEGVPESVVRAKYQGHDCQSRIDWVRPNGRVIDYKTCWDIDEFESDAISYGYVEQLAFYTTMMEISTDKKWDAGLIATEKKEPYRTGVWEIAAWSIERARLQNEVAMEELHRCREVGYWPTRYESVRVLNL